jgi:hypothetical protein
VDPILSANHGVVSSPTATEILERKAQALVLYKGKALILEGSILTPYIRSILESAHFATTKGLTYDVSYFTAEERRVNQVNAESLANKMAVMQNMGQEADPEDVEKFKTASDGMMQ